MHTYTTMNPHQSQGSYQTGDGDIKSLCRKYMNYHVIGQTSDGSQFDGIITDMDEESVSMLVPEWVDEEQETDMTSRQYGYGDGYGRRRFRRFRRRRFPFFFFGFPFFRPYPYYY
jgi:hypothetical protein